MIWLVGPHKTRNEVISLVAKDVDEAHHIYNLYPHYSLVYFDKFEEAEIEREFQMRRLRENSTLPPKEARQTLAQKERTTQG